VATTLTYGVTTLALPSDLLWDDEFAWTPVKATKGFTVAGALVVDRGVKLAGRPITLSGSEKHAWMPRSMALELLALAAIPGATMALVYRSVTYTVQFDHEADSPLVVTPVVDFSDPASGDFCYAVLKFIVTG
jgi:hypothetical protein